MLVLLAHYSSPQATKLGAFICAGAAALGKSSFGARCGWICLWRQGRQVRPTMARDGEWVKKESLRGTTMACLSLTSCNRCPRGMPRQPCTCWRTARGKSRASKEGNAVSAKSWRLMVLSSGELTLAAHTNDGGGAKVKAGAELRLLNIPADAGRGMGLFEEIHGFSAPADTFEPFLKNAAKMFYGTPLRAFIKWFVEHRDYALTRVADLQAGFGEAYIPAAASGEIDARGSTVQLAVRGRRASD